MDIFGWLCEGDYQDISNWVNEINHCVHLSVHKKCEVYRFDFYSECPMVGFEAEKEKDEEVSESDTEAQTEDVQMFINVQCRRGVI